MRHNIAINGFAFRLRPVKDSDAEMITALRHNPKLNQFLHLGAESIEDQLAWLARYYQRAGDYYFTIERIGNGKREGVISLYDIDTKEAKGEWGRWILTPGSLAAVESAYLIYRIAFEKMGLKGVYCRTVADNQKVVSFHDACGITNRSILKQHFKISGKRYDAIEHIVDEEIWNDVKPNLEKLAKMTARRVNRA